MPYLSTAVYKDAAQAQGQALLADQQTYYTLFAANTVTSDLISQAKTLVTNAEHYKSYVTNLLTQAEANYTDAVDARLTASANFSTLQISVIAAYNNLEQIGIPAYKFDKLAKAVFSMIVAVGEFTVGIVGMATGNEETTPAAAEGVAGATEVATQVKDGVQIANAMKELKKLVKLLNAVYNLASGLYKAGKDISKGDKPGKALAKLKTASDGISEIGVNGLAAWDTFALQTKNAIQPLIDANIEYANQYKNELATLVIYGKALCAAKIAEIKATQQCISLQTQLHYAEQNETSLSNEVAALEANQHMPLRLQQQFYHQYLEQKCNLFTILQNYQASYKYWALEAPATNPSLTELSDINSAVENLTDLTFEQMNALIHFNGGPQTMNSKMVPVTDTGVLAALKQNGKGQWVLELDEAKFSQYERVRVDCVRVWLDGDGLYDLSSQDNIELSLMIKTTGDYQDSFSGKTFKFNSAGLNRAFSYTVSKGSSGTHSMPGGLSAIINVDGSLAPSEQNDYFQPTPFSQWSLEIEKTGDSYPAGLDLTKLQTVTMEFKGSVIAKSNP